MSSWQRLCGLRFRRYRSRVLIKNFGNEFSILLDWDLNRLKEGMSEDLAQGIIDVRNGKVIIKPGYDGVYGTVKIFKNGLKNAKKQTKLF